MDTIRPIEINHNNVVMVHTDRFLPNNDFDQFNVRNVVVVDMNEYDQIGIHF